MKKLLTCLTAGLLVLGAQSLFAQSTTNSAPSDVPAAHKTVSPEQRKEAMKLIGLSGKDLKGLSREDRAAKIKEAVDKFMTDEKAKKTAGTFTAEDQTNIDLVKKVFAAHKKAKAASDN